MKLETALRKSLGIKKDERVLIITDRKKLLLAKKFHKAASKLSKKPVLIIKPVGSRDAEEPPASIAKKMINSDVVIAITTYSLTHTDATRAAWKNKASIATMPGFTEEMMPALFADPKTLFSHGKKIHQAMRKANNVRITTKSGTDISFSIKNRSVDIDAGLLNKRGSLGNLPAGEVSTSPVEGTADGVIVVDSMGVLCKKGTAIKVRHGNAVSISDESSKLAKIFNTVKNSRNVAELGIGTNPKARLIGYVLLDEKVAGTCHIAFGNNVNYGGKVNSKFHGDAILVKPDIYFDGKLFMKDGKLMMSAGDEI